MKQAACLCVLLICLLNSGEASSHSVKSTNSGNLSSLIERQQPSVVRVLATVLLKPNEDGSIPFKQGNGTGYVVNSGGYVVTALHTLNEVKRYGLPAYTIEYSETLTPEHRSSRSEPYFGVPVQVVATDDRRDIAVLKPLQATRQRPIHLSTDHVLPGEAVVLLGFPLTLETLAVRTGLIATMDTGEIEPAGHLKEAYWADLQISTGDSGGPIFRRTDGAVVGMVLKFANQASEDNTTKYNAGLSYVLASRYVVELLREHSIQFNENKASLPTR